MADQAMNVHKLKFFENAATPNLLLKFQQNLDPDQRTRLEEALLQRHSGVKNAWKTMVLEGGADAQVVGSQFEQMAFEAIQAAGENRIAIASRVPSVVLGIKEGAEQATYSNYGQAVRAFADHTMQHLWTHAAGVMGQIVALPAGKELAFDTRHISALQADAADEAKIRQTDAVTIRNLVDAGFEASTVIDAVTSGDFNLLQHSGLFSVQLQEAGADDSDEPAAADEPPDVDERFAHVVAQLKE
jgi:phage portal protein BeeE